MTEDLRELMQAFVQHQKLYEQALAQALGVDRSSLEVVYRLIVDGPRTPGALAAGTGFSAPVVTQVVNRLEAAGHVVRSRHPHDGRRVVVRVTDRSRRRAETVIAPMLATLHAVDADLDQDAVAVVAGYLRRSITGYQEGTAALLGTGQPLPHPPGPQARPTPAPPVV